MGKAIGNTDQEVADNARDQLNSYYPEWITYDELMKELIKRTRTLGGNAVGISDLNEKKETIFTNHKTKENNSDIITNSLIKETNLLSSVIADIFKCNSGI